MFKYHNGLPIILSMEESQDVIHKRFSDYLIFDIKLKFDDLTTYNQLDFIIFLRNICNDEELRQIFNSIKHYSKLRLFSVSTWEGLMGYEINPSFLDWRDRLDICVSIYRGTHEFERGEHNSFAYNLLSFDEKTLEISHPVLFRALNFYKITLNDLHKTYEYVKYSGSGGAN